MNPGEESVKAEKLNEGGTELGCYVMANQLIYLTSAEQNSLAYLHISASINTGSAAHTHYGLILWLVYMLHIANTADRVVQLIRMAGPCTSISSKSHIAHAHCSHSTALPLCGGPPALLGTTYHTHHHLLQLHQLSGLRAGQYTVLSLRCTRQPLLAGEEPSEYE